MTFRSGEQVHRRDFLRRAGLAAGGWLAAHEALVGRTKAVQSPTADPQIDSIAYQNRIAAAFAQPADPWQPRILALRLLTAAPLAAMRDFYHVRIGFAVIAESPEEITFAAGATSLTFAAAKPGQVHGNGGRGHGEPMYHFAFNIPRNSLRPAHVWQSQRSALVKPRAGLRDPALPDDIWHFHHWNAHSLFFFDPAYNIVEYIARHDLALDSNPTAAFSARDILYASEIGFVFDGTSRTQGEVPAATRLLTEKLGLEAYPRGAEAWAMGDERGLLLCLARKGDTWGDQTPTPVKWDVFKTQVVVAGPGAGAFQFESKPYEVSGR